MSSSNRNAVLRSTLRRSRVEIPDSRCVQKLASQRACSCDCYHAELSVPAGGTTTATKCLSTTMLASRRRANTSPGQWRTRLTRGNKQEALAEKKKNKDGCLGCLVVVHAARASRSPKKERCVELVPPPCYRTPSEDFQRSIPDKRLFGV